MERMPLGHSTVVAAKEQVFCNLADEVVILNLKAGVYFGLNAVAARIWNLIQEPRTVREIRDVIADEYDVDPDGCERDLLVLLRDLETQALIEVRDEAAAPASS